MILRHTIKVTTLFLALVFFLAVSVSAQLVIRDGTKNKPMATNLPPPEVIRVDYGAAIMARKVKGSFIKTGERSWIQTTPEGDTYWEETIRQNGSIYLYDTAAKKDIQINISSHTINTAGSFGNSLLHTILDIRMGRLQPASGVNLVTKKTVAPSPVVNSNGSGLDIPDLDVAPVYHAFLIAENKYNEASYHSLPGTVRDVRRIYELLTSRYTFDPENVEILVNATKDSILYKLNEKIKSLSDNDNLFIFYAGHGWIKKNAATGREEGFLIPSDATKGDEVSFINSYDITSIINRCKAKHILFTADACFAGSLFRDIPSEAPTGVKEAYKEKSRRLLSSGNLQAVSDESDFVESLRLALQENRAKYITAGKLLDGFKDQYIEKTHMQLQYSPIPNVDDQGGEFVFIRR